MTPNEVIKDTVTIVEPCYLNVSINEWMEMKEHGVLMKVKEIEEEKLSLLLSIKEMVGKNRGKYIRYNTTTHEIEDSKGYDQCIEELQSLLDIEINKIKEL